MSTPFLTPRTILDNDQERNSDWLGHGIVAEDKVELAIFVPAIEVLVLGEIGVAKHEDAAKAGAGRPGAAIDAEPGFVGGSREKEVRPL